MKKLILIFVVLFTCLARLQAQYYTNENKQWVFGVNAGLDFSSGVPVPFTSSFWSNRACAAVADFSGNMLFYTQGDIITNRLHMVMPSGYGVLPYTAVGAAYETLIVPMPGDPGKYYVFSLDDTVSTSPTFDLFYTIVDMSLDGGLGDVIPGAAGTHLFDSLTDKIVAVKGEGCSVWLITHLPDINQFLAFRITPSGIAPPVLSTCGSLSGLAAYSVGKMKASHNRRHLVVQSMQGYGGSGTELYDFDTTTGIVSNCRLLSTATGQYGAEFSPDNSKLYTQNSATSTGSSGIYQYDISLPTVVDIIASRVLIHTSPGMTLRDLKLAPDNKIYVRADSPAYLDCIPSPDVAGIGCGYVSNAINVGNLISIGLPTTVVVSDHISTTSFSALHFCFPADTARVGAAFGTDFLYAWHDGTSVATHSITSSGLYWVYASNGCISRRDSFNVVVDTLYPINLGNDTTISFGNFVALSAPHPAGASVHWSTGSTSDTIHAAAGTYWATVTLDGCSVTDTINIFPPAGFAPITGAAHIVIYPNPANDIITLKATALSGNAVTVLCYNMVGSNVLTHNYQVVNGTLNAPIAVGTLPAGVYYLCIEDGAGRSGMQKVIIGHHN